jgi:hypothetical protein
MHAGLPSHGSEHAVAFDLEDDFLDSVQRAFGHRHYLDFQPRSAKRV